MLAGTLQTINLRPPMTAGSGIFRRRISCFPSPPLRCSGDFAFATANFPHIGETRPVCRSIRATGGSDQGLWDSFEGAMDSSEQVKTITFLTVKPAAFAIAISTGILLYIALLAFNTLAVQILSKLINGKEPGFAKKENSRAVIIVASQKTLPVMVAVVEQLRGALGEPGLLELPCVAAHINQMVIDSFLVNLWLQRDRPTAKAK